jgi:GTP-binding protein HflX
VAEVFRVLGEIGAAETPQILVLNKADRLPAEERDAAVPGARLLADAGQSPLTPAVMVSSLTGEGLARLFDRIDEVVPFDALETVQFRIPLRDGASIAMLHERGRVRKEVYDGNLCVIEVDAPESLRRRLRRYLRGNSAAPVENSVHN